MDNFDVTSFCADLMSVAQGQDSSSNSHDQHLSSLITTMPPLYYTQTDQPLVLQYPTNNIYIHQHLPYIEPPPLIELSTANNGVDMTQGSSSASVYMEPGNSCGDLPPGYRFKPTDEELILHYLMKKASNQPLPCNYIVDVDVYKCTPWNLAEKLMLKGDNKGYCFTPRDRKYAGGQRPNRRAIDGYWKATAAEQKIKYNHRKPYHDNVYGDIVHGDIIGTKRALVFYRGRPPKGDKTQWIMHEYNLYNQEHKKGTAKGSAKDMKLDNCVLCSIYYKGKTLKGSSHHDNVNELGTLDSNHNDDNVQESSSFAEYVEEVEQFLLDSGSESFGVPPNDNVQESSSSVEYIQEVERHLYSGSESFGVSPNNSANHIHNHNTGSFEEDLMKFLYG